MSTLFFIPARGGSKSIPGKNYRDLYGKPPVQHTLEIARAFAGDDDICVSTDDDNVIKVMGHAGYQIPFRRPEYLASDTASMYDTIMHAIQHYLDLGRSYDRLILLQPTSPFLKKEHVAGAIALYDDTTESVVSVKETKSNPYYMLLEENQQGWLEKSKQADFVRRQDVPVVYELNGAIYVLRVSSLKEKPMSKFERIRKYVMDEVHSHDLDTPFDWIIAETLLEKGLVKR